MFVRALKVFIASVHIAGVMLLAGTYVYTYYDYLHTVLKNGGVTISDSRK